MDTDVADVAQGILSLGKTLFFIFCVIFLSLFFFFLFSCLRLAGTVALGQTGEGVGEDRPMPPVRGLALGSFGGPAIGLNFLGALDLQSLHRLALKVDLCCL